MIVPLKNVTLLIIDWNHNLATIIFTTTKQLFSINIPYGTAFLQMWMVINRLLKPKFDICNWLQVTVAAFISISIVFYFFPYWRLISSNPDLPVRHKNIITFLS